VIKHRKTNMKFLETLNGSFINFNEISVIKHDLDKEMRFYYSHIHLRDGTIYDLLDIYETFIDKDGSEIKLEYEHVLILHEIACNIIGEQYSAGVLLWKELDKKVWKEFTETWKTRVEERKQ
jgi:hypothetical protein